MEWSIKKDGTQLKVVTIYVSGVPEGEEWMRMV